MGVFDIPILGENKTEQLSGEAPKAATSPFTLRDLSAEWSFFNHGTLFKYAGFEDPFRDPVSDWFNSFTPQPEFLKQAFERQIFDGLDTPAYLGPRARPTTWNHVICGVRTCYWPQLLDFIAGVVAHDPRTKEYFQVFYGTLDILDPGFVERHSLFKPGLPTVSVTCFCVESNRRRWEFQKPLSDMQPPYIMEMPPRPEVQQIAKSLQAGDLAPLQAKMSPAQREFLKRYQATLKLGPKIGPSVGADVKELFRGNRD